MPGSSGQFLLGSKTEKNSSYVGLCDELLIFGSFFGILAS